MAPRAGSKVRAPPGWSARFSRELLGLFSVRKRLDSEFSRPRLAREASRYLPEGFEDLTEDQVNGVFKCPRFEGLPAALAVARVLKVSPQEVARLLMGWKPPGPGEQEIGEPE